MSQTMNELAQQLGRPLDMNNQRKRREESSENKIKLWNSLDKVSNSSLGRRENRRYYDEDMDDDEDMNNQLDETIIESKEVSKKPPQP